MVKIKFSKENGSVIIPSKHEADAGYDLYIDAEWFKKEHGRHLKINPNETVMLSTGLRSIIEKEWYAQIQERGSTGIKGMKYGAGVIDASYRGTWNIVITNCSTRNIIIYDPKTYDPDIDSLDVYYSSSKAIAQFILLPVQEVEIEEVEIEEVLNKPSHRGEGKLGSSGK